jgi:hypothetical protein
MSTLISTDGTDQSENLSVSTDGTYVICLILEPPLSVPIIQSLAQFFFPTWLQLVAANYIHLSNIANKKIKKRKVLCG